MISIARVVVECIAPLPVSLIFLLTGLLFFSFNKKKAGLFFVSGGTGILLFCGCGFYANDALYRLERQFKPFNIEQLSEIDREQVKFIVVLGSGHVSDPTVSVSSHIGGASLYRLVEAVGLLPHFPLAQLVLSGGRHRDPVANAEVVKQMALQLGVKEERVIMEDRPVHTFEEAKLLAPLLGNDPFILVTSAAHMPRAMELFKKFKTKPLPACTDYITKKLPNDTGFSLIPSCRNLEISKRLFYEWLGTLWGLMKNK